MSDRQKQRERYEVRAAEFEVMRLTTADRPLQRRYGEFEARYRELADSFGEAIQVHGAALTALEATLRSASSPRSRRRSARRA